MPVLATLCWLALALPASADTAGTCIVPNGVDWCPFPQDRPISPRSSSGGTGSGSPFTRSGPLSTAAANRAENVDSQMLTGVQPVAAGTGVNCTTATCYAAQATYSSGASAARQLLSSAQAVQSKELGFRQEIQNAVQNGGYSSDDVKKFSQTFNSQKFPTDESIQKLPPSLQDAAYALRTSRAIEQRIGETAGTAQRTAARNGNMENAVGANIGKAASIGDGKSVTPQAGDHSGDPSSRPIPAPPATAAAVTPASVDPHRNLQAEGSGSNRSSLSKEDSQALDSAFGAKAMKPIPAVPAALGDHDKTLMAQMMDNLASEIAETGGKGQGGEPAAAAGSSADEWMVASGGISGKLGTGAGVSPSELRLPAGLRGVLGAEFGSVDETIFHRVHRRIEACAARVGLGR